jgi:hypothetical protein
MVFKLIEKVPLRQPFFVLTTSEPVKLLDMSHKISFLLILALCGIVACDYSSEQELSATTEEWTNARLTNQLPVDGCDWHLGVDLKDEWGQFVPNDKTTSIMKDFIEKSGGLNAPMAIEVQVIMKPTGKKKSVVCGFNTKADMDEVELFEIRKR